MGIDEYTFAICIPPNVAHAACLAMPYGFDLRTCSSLGKSARRQYTKY